MNVYISLFVSALTLIYSTGSWSVTDSECRLHLTEAEEVQSYLADFSRNLGIVTPQQQLDLSRKRIAIAGVGGIGGEALETLSEMGVGGFVLADPDHFERHNKNKQSAANDKTIGRLKVDVGEEDVKARNAFTKVKTMPEGINANNIDEFLSDVDLVVDGMDVFNMATRRLVFNRAMELGIPVVTVGPLGRTVAGLSFKPGGMTYDDYFDVNDQTPEQEHLIHFLVGLAPKYLHKGQIIKDYVDYHRQQAPAYATATKVAAGHIGEMVSAILLNTHEVLPAPWSFQYDITSQRVRRVRLLFGNRGPLQRVRLALAKREWRAFIESKEPEVR